MKKFFQRLKNILRKERGALVIEAAFVYPIMFFVLMFLLYMGNMYYLKAKISSVVSQEAITYAEKFADPNYETFQQSIPAANGSDVRVTQELYRYIDILNLSDYGTATESEKNKLKKQIEDTGFYTGMTPANITIEKHQVHNYIVYQTYEVQVDYELIFPIRFIFEENPVILHMTAREETPVIDTSEFIRNVDMAVDFLEQTEKAGEVSKKLNEAYARIDKFINGDPRDPTQAVAGGTVSDENSNEVNDKINNLDASKISEDDVGTSADDRFIRNEKGQKVLKPDNEYDSNGYHYKTDSKGRIVSVTGTITKDKMDHPGKRNQYAQRVVGREDRNTTKKPKDDGGHLIGSQFGGSGDLDNLVPMSSKTNRSGGEWYTMEQIWAKEARNGHNVDVTIEIHYDENSQRPTEFIVEYYVDGERRGRNDPIKNE